MGYNLLKPLSVLLCVPFDHTIEQVFDNPFLSAKVTLAGLTLSRLDSGSWLYHFKVCVMAYTWVVEWYGRDSKSQRWFMESTLRYLQQKHFKTMGLPGLCYLMTRKEINLVKSPFPYTLPRPDPITSISTSCSDSIRVHPKRVHVSSNGFPEGTAFKKRSHDLGIQPRHDFQLPFFWGIFGHLAGERNSPGKRNIPLGEMPWMHENWS